MIYLLWALLNVGLFLFFIAICLRATVLIREKFGLFASIVFVFGLLSFVSGSGDEDENVPDSNGIRTWEYASGDSLRRTLSSRISIELEETSIAAYELRIEYGEDKQKRNIPISAYSSTSGWASGTDWKPHSILVRRTSDNHRFEYLVIGTVEWTLLGMSIYSQPKEYKGIALTK